MGCSFGNAFGRFRMQFANAGEYAFPFGRPNSGCTDGAGCFSPTDPGCFGAAYGLAWNASPRGFAYAHGFARANVDANAVAFGGPSDANPQAL